MLIKTYLMDCNIKNQTKPSLNMQSFGHNMFIWSQYVHLVTTLQLVLISTYFNINCRIHKASRELQCGMWLLASYWAWGCSLCLAHMVHIVHGVFSGTIFPNKTTSKMPTKHRPIYISPMKISMVQYKVTLPKGSLQKKNPLKVRFLPNWGGTPLPNPFLVIFFYELSRGNN